MLAIEAIPLLKDNYAWLLRDAETGVVAVVDPSESEPVVALLESRGLGLDLVINTHHHGDHVGGNRGLKSRFQCVVVGPDYDKDRLIGLDHTVREGDAIDVGKARAQVMHIPAHTTGHIAVWFAESKAVFVGDTLFSLGCGRLFEGTPRDLKSSLDRLRALPEDTRIYCGHEYTEANARFALTVDPHNKDLQARHAEVRALRQRGLPTVPSILGEELRANPFLRAATAEELGRLRAMKDGFRG